MGSPRRDRRSRSRSRNRRYTRSSSPSPPSRSSRHARGRRRSPRRDGDRHFHSQNKSRNESRNKSRSRSREPSDARASAVDADAVVLPAAAHREELLSALRAHQIVVCVGETGSGKTTQIPQYLLHALQTESSFTGTNDPNTTGSVVITQPRRVATVSVAQRVAEEMGFRRLAGSPVGYTIRFDDQTSAATRLKFVTDGVLVRECLRDPLLSKYAVVMLDEAHERSLHTDILFGLLKQVLTKRRDLRLLVTSATLDADKFAAFFRTTDIATPIVRIPGRSFPVDIFHSKQMQIMGIRGPLSPYVRAAVETTLQVHYSEPPGHILVFLTGQHEIEDACAQLRRLYQEKKNKTDEMEMQVLPLYGALSGRTQREIFTHVAAQRLRKVIVATNIAETSLTIDGIRYVIDSGFTKQKVYNPEKQIESLVVVPISQVSAQQRAGRAGRTAPGKCFRLYSKPSYEQMLDESIPEIQRTNLANTVLYLKVLGVHNVLAFEFLDPPEQDALLDALQQLFVLDALDAQGHVTTLGKLMAQFPLEPKLSRVLIEAMALQCEDDMASIVAMLSVENVYAQQQQTTRNEKTSTGDGENDETTTRDDLMLRLTKEDLVDDRGDQLTYLRLLTTFTKLPVNQRHRWCETRELRFRALSTATSIRRQLLDVVASLPAEDVRLLRERGDTDTPKRSRTTRLRRALCAGFFSQAARRCNTQSAVYRSLDLAPSGGDDDGDDDSKRRVVVQLLHLHPLSTLNYVSPPPCCVYQELVATSRPFMRDVVHVEESWVREYACGKAQISTAQLFALSGAELPQALLEAAAHRKSQKPMHEPSRAQAASEPTESKESKALAVSAARTRFLARQKLKST